MADETDGFGYDDSWEYAAEKGLIKGQLEGLGLGSEYSYRFSNETGVLSLNKNLYPNVNIEEINAKLKSGENNGVIDIGVIVVSKIKEIKFLTPEEAKTKSLEESIS